MFLCLRMAFYAVAKGRQVGIFRTWGECESQVKGFSGSRFKKFSCNREAQAFLEGHAGVTHKRTLSKRPSSFNFVKAFDNAEKKAKKKKTLSGTKSDSDSDDDNFMEFPEYPDDSKASSSKASSTPCSSKLIPAQKSSDQNEKLKDRGIKFEPPAKTTGKLYNGIEFEEDSKGFVHVYTDGSCIGNGKYSAVAGLGVYFGDDHVLNVSEPVSGRPTNNVGEIQASIRAIRDAQNYGVKRLNILTDSQFLINSVCKWIKSWKKKDWKLASGKSVVNQKDFKELDQLIESGNMLIKWSYIPAHKGYRGNEEADRLAKIGASLYRKKCNKNNEIETIDISQ